MFKEAYWIKPHYDYKDVCPVFIRKFDVKARVKKAVLCISAMGVYEAEINGKRVGNFIMAPGWTSYHKRHQYQEYDVTDLILFDENKDQTENEITVNVGKGWYRGRLVTYGFTDCYGGVTAMIAQLTVTYEDGSHTVIPTDNRWESAESAVRFSEIYDGEIYDATFSEQNRKKTPRFHAPKTQLIPQEGEFVTEHEHIRPVRMFKTPKGETVIDFGQNITGYVSFDICAKKGDRLCYSHAEILDGDGNFYTENLRSAKQMIVYICKEGRQSYKPHHTFMGFRYIRLEEFPPNISADDFEAIAVYSNMKRTGHFKCSNEKVNKLYSNIIWSQKDNFLDVPTDCPQRDERLGWTADAQVFGRAAMYNFDVRRFFSKWLNDLSTDQYPNGTVPYIVPDVLDGREEATSAAYGDAAVIIPWEMYRIYGDKKILERQIDSMIAWVEYMHGYGEEEYLWLGHTQLGDWLHLDRLDNPDEIRRRDDFIASAYFAHSTYILSKALEIIGRPNEKYVSLHDNITKAFKRRFCEYYSQTECTLALAFNLTDDREQTAAQLAGLIQKNNGALSTGFLATSYLLTVLSENGYNDIAYSLLLKESYPSWLYSVNLGATTIWEHWDGINENGEFWSAKMNSFNHYSFGSIAAWMYETVLGIKLNGEKNGRLNIRISPMPNQRLDWAEGSVKTDLGEVFVRWENSCGKTKYNIRIPAAAQVNIGGKIQELSKGEYEF